MLYGQNKILLQNKINKLTLFIFALFNLSSIYQKIKHVIIVDNMLIQLNQLWNGVTAGTPVDIDDITGITLINSGVASLLDLNDASDKYIKMSQGYYGNKIIVGNTAVIAPDGFCFGSFTCRTDGVIIAALKKDAVLTPIVAGSINGEEVLKTTPLVLANGEWQPFANKITSIQLTGANDSISAWLKPLA